MQHLKLIMRANKEIFQITVLQTEIERNNRKLWGVHAELSWRQFMSALQLQHSLNCCLHSHKRSVTANRPLASATAQFQIQGEVQLF